MVDSTYLLDDAAMQKFIMEGYLQLQSRLPLNVHERIYSALGPLDEGGPRGHNNLLPCVPDLQLLLNEPTVVGALESLLGPNYHLHFHRHDHINFPDSVQPLHKDGDNHSHLAIDGLRRHHPTRYVMLLYYPQDTPLSAGPTGIVPQTQYLIRRTVESARAAYAKISKHIPQAVRQEIQQGRLKQSQFSERVTELAALARKKHPSIAQNMEQADVPWEAKKIPITGKAGTVTIVHFDIVHGRYSKNELEKPRHMVKFLFTRNEEPAGPSWRNASKEWGLPVQEKQAPIWDFIWHWHLGETLPQFPNKDVSNAIRELDSDNDATATGASYALSRTSEGIDLLFDRFLDPDIERRTIASYGIAAAREIAVTKLLKLISSEENSSELLTRVVDVLGDIGPAAERALPILITLADHKEPSVRRYVAEAIGMIAERKTHLDDRCIEALAQLSTDEDALTRRNAVFAVAKLSTLAKSDTIITALKNNLFHWHHHVRGWSVEALRRIDDKEATAYLLQYLSMTRWDPLPKSGDRTAKKTTMREE